MNDIAKDLWNFTLIIHRDIKPSNLIIASDDNLYLTDFDISELIFVTFYNITYYSFSSLVI